MRVAWRGLLGYCAQRRGDVARQPARIKTAFTVGSKELAAAVANRSLGRSRDAKDSRALAVLSQVVGAVILARASMIESSPRGSLVRPKRICYRPRIAPSSAVRNVQG